MEKVHLKKYQLQKKKQKVDMQAIENIDERLKHKEQVIEEK